MQIKGAIFDLDGTLFDSTWVWHQIDIDFLGSRGFDVPPDYVEIITPMTFQEVADYTIERFQLPEKAEEIMAEWNAMAKEAYAKKIQIKPGTIELLSELKKRGIKMGVATSNISDLFIPCLKRNGIFDYFDVFMECNEVGKSKKFPDIYIKAAESMNCKPEECLVFEDITEALRTAKKSGFVTVCAKDDAWEYDAEELQENADYILEKISDALSLLNQWK